LSNQQSPYIYHGQDVSYFSGKARPALPQKSLWYREVTPDYPEIKKHTGLYFIPALFTPEGEALQDTSEILDYLEQRHPEPPLYPSTPVQRVVAYLIEVYGDEVGILPAMHYRWSFPESAEKAIIDFGFATGDMERARSFAGRMSGSLPGLGINENTIPAIEAHLRELLDTLSAHFESQRFLLGDSMSLGDCGLMGPMYAHLFRDAVPERLLYQTAFRVSCWVERMNRPPRDQQGFLPDDALAETLLPVLGVMADGIPFLLDALGEIESWADEHAADAAEIPRAVGMFESTFRGVPIQLAVRPYTLWMLQRPLDAYRALNDAERQTVDQTLAGTGWEKLLAYTPRHRLCKKNFQLAWE
jgi:glutathione S-transferase